MQMNVTEVTSDKSFHVDIRSVVNCSANGYEVPTVQWIAINSTAAVNDSRSPGLYKVGPGWALLSFTTIGTETWNCSASNDPGFPPPLNVTVRFKGLVI